MKQKAPPGAESEDGKVLEVLRERRSSVMASGSGETELGLGSDCIWIEKENGELGNRSPHEHMQGDREVSKDQARKRAMEVGSKEKGRAPMGLKTPMGSVESTTHSDPGVGCGEIATLVSRGLQWKWGLLVRAWFPFWRRLGKCRQSRSSSR